MVKLPQFNKKDRELMLTISEIESCVQVEGGTVITMKSGRQHWTSANLDTVEQFIKLYKDTEE